MGVQGINNRFLTPDEIAKEALRRLKNNLVLARLVYRGYEKEFKIRKIGDTIQIKKPFKVKSTEGRTLGKQPMVDETTSIKIDRQRNIGLEATSMDYTLAIEDFGERYLNSAIQELASQVDLSIAEALRKGGFYGSNAPGSAVNINAFLTARASQNKVAVPNDKLRRAIINSDDAANISKDIINKFNEDFVKKGITEGYMGKVAGYDLFETQSAMPHEVGDYAGTPVVNGSPQNGDVLQTSGWAANAELKEGDVFTIDGVYSVNPVTRKSTGQLMRFVVTEDVTADGSGNMDIPISPAINDGSVTVQDSEGNSVSAGAYQNISNPVPDGAGITVIGDANKIYNMNYLFHRDAVALVMCELELPRGAVVKARARDPQTGLTIMLVEDYDITEQKEITRLDIVWGVKAIYPELIHKMYSEEVNN